MGKIEKEIVKLGDVAKRHPIFYVPPILVGGVFLGWCIVDFGSIFKNTFVRLLSWLIGTLVLLFFFLMTIAIAWILGKDLYESKPTPGEKK